MPRTLVLAAALAAAPATDAMAYRWQWEGTVQILSVSQDCNVQFVPGENLRAIYQPNLPSVLDRNSSLTIFRKTGTEMIQHEYSSGQFSGQGYYNWFIIADGKADESFGYGYSEYEFQNFDFTQTPAAVISTTNFVTLSGSLHDYGGIEDCTVTLRGNFVAVDSETPPPPPYDD